MTEIKLLRGAKRVEHERAVTEARRGVGLTLSSNDDGIMINGYYFIDWYRIATAAQVVGWIEHLSEKYWWDNRFTLDLIRAVGAYKP